MAIQSESYKRKIINELLSEKTEISYKEFLELNPQEREHVITLATDKYYKVTPIEATREQIDEAIQLRICEQLEDMNNKQSTIKNIMIFWLILTIIKILLAFNNLSL